MITADTRPIRVKPENPGGMKIDGAENDVFSGGSDTSNAKLAAAAENPDTEAAARRRRSTIEGCSVTPAFGAPVETPSQSTRRSPATPATSSAARPSPSSRPYCRPPAKPAVVAKPPAAGRG